MGREERVVKAVLMDEFMEAAREYADELHKNREALEIQDVQRLVEKRERFLTLYLMVRE